MSKPIQPDTAAKFIQQNPYVTKWIHTCAKCERQGYKPNMPVPAKPNPKDEDAMLAWNTFRTMKRFFKKMVLNPGGICESCFMGSVAIPPTLHSFRNKIPKILSHVLQTTDFLAYFDGKIFKLRTSLYYSDIKKVNPAFYSLLGVRYRGDHHKYFDGYEQMPRIELSVGAVPREFRKGIREFLTQRILPFVSTWLVEQIEAGVQNDSVLRIAAHMPTRNSKDDLITITEQGKEIRKYALPWKSFAA